MDKPVSELFGQRLRVRVYGASHAPEIRVQIDGLPRGFKVDLEKLQALLDRRAPGKDKLSTQRRQLDKPIFVSGLDQRSALTGQTLAAAIKNADFRSSSYDQTRTKPRPGHADLTQWLKTGQILPGGGPHSGRMTALLCIAGGLCQQLLESVGVHVQSRVIFVGGSAQIQKTVLEAKAAGDSVGGIIQTVVTGLSWTIGGPMFDGVQCQLARLVFAVPGVKGVQIGDGFKLASMRGSQANDQLFFGQDGRVRARTNHCGGLLGGSPFGEPLVVRCAMKPTPSISLKQKTVDLARREDTQIQIRGRHDPCIALRAAPAIQSAVALAIADLMLASGLQLQLSSIGEHRDEDHCKSS